MGYIDYREFEHNFIAGETYELTVKSTFFEHYLTVWIDFNDNLEFTEDEMVLYNGFCEMNETEYTFTITIPENIPIGDHVMRVRSSFGPITDACETYDDGITMDFIAKITDNMSLVESTGINTIIYPNPFEDILNIQLPKDIKDEYMLTVIDMSGKIIDTKFGKLSGQNLNYDGGKLSPGIYILRIKAGNKMIVEKVIKK